MTIDLRTSSDSLGETIDRLMSLELRPTGFLSGVVPKLYDAARRQVGDPLAWTAASRLLEDLHDGDTVVIVTGHVHPVVMPLGETDGPPGAAVLARVLNLACNVQVVLQCDSQVTDVMQAVLRRAGLRVETGLPTAGAQTQRPAVHLSALPTDLPAAEQAAQALFQTYPIRAAISIEKIAPNDRGTLHTGFGNKLVDVLGRGDAVIERAKQLGALTIGIGDLGNEIGFGSLTEVVEAVVPFGQRCACDCGGGIAAATTTDYVLPAGTSNWGGYALAAALCALTGRLDLLHDSATDFGILEAAINAGATDGLSAGPTMDADGIPAAVHGHWVDLMSGAVRIACSESPSVRAATEALERTAAVTPA